MTACEGCGSYIFSNRKKCSACGKHFFDCCLVKNGKHSPYLPKVVTPYLCLSCADRQNNGSGI